MAHEHEDQCEHCSQKGSIETCLGVDCSVHNAWIVRHLLKTITVVGQKVSDATALCDEITNYE